MILVFRLTFKASSRSSGTHMQREGGVMCDDIAEETFL